MGFKNDREFWIFVMTVFHTSEMAKSLPIKQQQAICEFIKKRQCPNLTYDTWLDIERSIVSSSKLITEVMTRDLMNIMSGQVGNIDKKLDIQTVREMDEVFKKSLDELDLDKIKQGVKNIPAENKTEIDNVIKTIEDYKKERAEFRSKIKK